MDNRTQKLRVLVIGGYGTFGGHLVRRLAADTNLALLIAGRNIENARAFIAGMASIAALQAQYFDRNGDVKAQLLDIAPHIVVDASGPFQAYGDNRYHVAEAAIEIGAHYLDLADDSRFVAEISALNERASLAGVFVISGASTTPALTSAVYRRLARHFATVDSFQGGIAPSPHAGIGISVVRAIAAYAGKALDLLHAGNRATGYAICETQAYSICAPGALPLRRRRFSLVDVPDLLLSNTLDSRIQNTWFGAAPVPAIYHFLLRVLARLVKWRIVPSVAVLAPLMRWVLNHWSFGPHRGGMFVELTGTDKNGQAARYSWDLVADGDDGPVIPTLAAEAIIRACVNDRAPHPGARPATHELELEEFEQLFTTLKISFGERSASLEPPLIARLLGSRYAELPATLRALHDVQHESSWLGEANVSRGIAPAARLIAAIVGFPRDGMTVPLRVTLTRSRDSEIWRRDFDGRRFSSVLSSRCMGSYANLLCERFGPVSIGMALVVNDGTLNLVPQCWQLLRIPMPRFLLPRGRMFEYSEHGRFHFHVEIRIPLIGHVVTYAGWLNRDG